MGLFVPLIHQSNIFIENEAIYGNDIAAFPIRLSIIINSTINESNNSVYFDSNIMNQFIFLVNVSNGQPVPYSLKLQLYDIYGALVFINSGYFINQ